MTWPTECKNCGYGFQPGHVCNPDSVRVYQGEVEHKAYMASVYSSHYHTQVQLELADCKAKLAKARAVIMELLEVTYPSDDPKGRTQVAIDKARECLKELGE